ncbi:sulfurtransferase complex subunit TusB [Paraglaciecola aquimarina]|uniref:Sulfurtransferase complex subunit TusB n=1 Tax=Paraglaciecola aquimarina TaxID=1235557 RepID=A0ABU3SYB0_9ALTE|nr:sulfurtransferase complex subunit TusB [Paraglaciecola aquimarina]MDU0354991.1 sulfurtransferase complex subunit TusB [Paraglaciecola aquimarina]
MILHKLSASPFSEHSLNHCLQRVAKTDKILLTQDAVYAYQHAELNERLANFSPVYCIADDLIARGITLNNPKFKAIDYAEFVELTLTCKQMISW